MTAPTAETSATAFAPAGVGNVSVGFDILGHSIVGPGDRATVRRIDSPTVEIANIEGVVTGLPLEPERNTAGRALIALRETLNLPFGFSIELHKGIPLGSGMGGSAASCVAALLAANALLDTPLSREELYPFALDGEAIVTGARNGDNVGPMLLGGLVLTTPERLVPLTVPAAWHCVLVHPHHRIETRAAREVLPATCPMSDITRQTGNLALFLTGCARGDADLVRAGFNDALVEPRRAPLIPGFDAVRNAALEAGALGAGISGAGPSVFAWFTDRADAECAAPKMQAAFGHAGLDSDVVVSPVAGPRAELILPPSPSGRRLG
ncbi:MAG TPA: homoserine kinase [Gammaproteobacteria bacterium]|nr:homoserine kinase [Gammaproteobacteria bacterium]